MQRRRSRRTRGELPEAPEGPVHKDLRDYNSKGVETDFSIRLVKDNGGSNSVNGGEGQFSNSRNSDNTPRFDAIVPDEVPSLPPTPVQQPPTVRHHRRSATPKKARPHRRLSTQSRTRRRRSLDAALKAGRAVAQTGRRRRSSLLAALDAARETLTKKGKRYRRRSSLETALETARASLKSSRQKVVSQITVETRVTATIQSRKRRSAALEATMAAMQAGQRRRISISSNSNSSKNSNNKQKQKQRQKQKQPLPATTKATPARNTRLSWMEMYHRLISYKRQHNGSTNVRYTYDGDKKLGPWVTKQRQRQKTGKLPQTQQHLLRSVGFDFHYDGRRTTE